MSWKCGILLILQECRNIFVFRKMEIAQSNSNLRGTKCNYQIAILIIFSKFVRGCLFFSYTSIVFLGFEFSYQPPSLLVLQVLQHSYITLFSTHISLLMLIIKVWPSILFVLQSSNGLLLFALPFAAFSMLFMTTYILHIFLICLPMLWKLLSILWNHPLVQ